MAPKRKRQKLVKTVLPNLPKEVWCIIFSSLPNESRKDATSTCKLWFEIIRGNSRFSGNITIPWNEIQNSNFDWNNWPSLKTLDIKDSSFPSPKVALEAMRYINFKKCQSLEKVTFGVNFDVAELSGVMITTTTKTIKTKTTTAISGEKTNTDTEKVSTSQKYVRKFMKGIGTVLAMGFNPKLRIDLFNLEHLNKLEIHMKSQSSGNIKRTLKIMKMIGEAAINLRWLIVGGDSFDHPKFFETGFQNFGTSLKVFTLKNDCFEGQDDCDGDYVNSVNMFFRSLNESYPNLSCLNLCNASELDGCEPNSPILSMAGFEMVKELNVDFRFLFDDEVGGRFDWFFGLINDCNNIETLSLNGLIYPFFGWDNFEMASIRDKYKNLKKCQISFNEEFERHFDYIGNGISCKEYTTELAEDLDKTFADRSTEFKVIIRAKEGDEEGKCFQIIKMPFKNSVVTKLE